MSFGLGGGGRHGFYLLAMGSMAPKTHGMRAKLLPREKLRAVVYAETLDDALATLRDSSYKAAIERLSKESPPEEVTKEFKSLVVQDLVSLMAGSPTPARILLAGYLLKFEIENIKMIARGLYEGKERKDIERILNMYVAEIMGRRYVLTYILGARDLEDLGNKLRELFHPAAPIFESILRLVKAKPQLALCAIDTLLDKVYLVRLYNLVTTRLIRDNSGYDVVKQLIDMYNASLLLRAKMWNIPHDLVMDFVVPYGAVGKAFHRLYGEPIVRVVEELAENPLIRVITSITRATELDQIVPKLSIAMYKAVRVMAESIASRYGAASPGAALAVACLRDMEAELVSAVIRSFMEGVSKNVIRSHFGLAL